MFQFHIPFAPYCIWKQAVFTLLLRLKCPRNLSFEQQKVSSELLEKIKYKRVLVQQLWSAWYKSVHD